jgi:hypothetical protein
MAKIVFIQESIVTEVTSWDGSPFVNPPNRTVIIVSDTHAVQVGWLWSGSTNTLFPTVQTVGPRRVEKIDFMRLFTLEERVRYNALRKITDGLTSAEYMSQDPMNQLFVALDIVFDSFDLAAMIELDHPETQQGMGLLAAAGVFGTDPSHQNSRISQVLAAQLP